MIALMGPSGAGKSTLLDVLANRKSEGTIYGGVENRAESSCYVMQSDCHIGNLTVLETLEFASLLRNPKSWTKDQHDSRVNYLLTSMGLSHISTSYVGSSFTRGISGGQLKRLSIAVECITLPGLIFLDEPTSGLDSSISIEVMSAVRKLCDDGGRAVICTIHQPSIDCFEMFDDLLLLSEGRVIYEGPRNKAVQYFNELGYQNDKDTNPADFICEVAGGMVCGGGMDPNVSYGESHIKSPRELEKLFKSSNYHTPVTIDPNSNPKSRNMPKNPNNTFTQFRTLLNRGMLTNKRNTAYRNSQIIKNIIVGILAGVIFYQQGSMSTSVWNTTTDFPESAGYNVVSILYFAILYSITGNLQSIPMLFQQKLMFVRERSAGAYTTLPYWMCNSLVNLPLIIGTHILFTNLTYWLVGLPADPVTVGYMFLNTLMVNLISFYFSQLLAASCSSSQVALAVFPILFMFLSNFAGFTILLDNVQAQWCWAPYVSFPRWAYEGLVYVTFDQKKPENYENILAYFGFDDWEAMYSICILVPYAVLVNFWVLYALMPPTSKVRYFKSKSEDQIVNGGRNDQRSDSRSSSLAMNMESFANAGPPSSLASRPTSNQRPTDLPTSPLLERVENDTIPEDSEVEPSQPLLNAPLSPSGSELPVGNPEGRRGSWSVDDFKRNSENIQLATQRGLNVTFSSLNYSVHAPTNPKADQNGMLHILSSVEGRAASGEMVALMGASGAGKSTLLDILAGRKTLDKTTTLDGVLLFNGAPRSRPIMRRSAYVTQDNVHLASLTVRQTLEFAASLRMESSNKEERRERVLTVAKMLGIDKILDNRVGGELIRGISGGQLKRLSIAVEIISLPELIFLDEPTTGLDSAIAHEVMSAVRNLANFNRTVICTIHQPPPATFRLFDKLLLLANGRTCYYGDVDDAPLYFNKFGYVFDEDKVGSNPAEFVVAVAGGFEKPNLAPDRLCDDYMASESHMEFQEQLTENLESDRNRTGENQNGAKKGTTYPSSLGMQCYTLACRQIVKTAQDKRPLIAGIMRHIVVALFYGSIYRDLKGSPNPQILERCSLCFFTLMFVTMGQQQNIPIIFDERLLFYRERGAKVYGNFSYWLTGGVSVTPLTLGWVAIFCAILYPLSGFRKDWESAIFFYIIAALTSLCGLFYCQMLAVLSPTQQSAITLFPATLFFFISFAGYIVQLPSLPDWLSQVPNVSFLRWGFQALVINELEDNTFVFPAPTTEVLYKAFAEQYGIYGYSKWTSVPYLAINMGVFRLFTFLGLRYVRYEKR
ncbi:hypothetical protein TrLO_g8347 [Triparma laevis f. longispina]|uniref:ABC transporter domain-containing protein n=1 Tax=Triparma laevis f. longispina TaxID=1714387 RepID=A0A9W7KT27_9STRA|nr:hypothetical protein TrLO_g8347 [Triparma laevis f. longispina]